MSLIALQEALTARFKEALLSAQIHHGALLLVVNKDALLAVAEALHTEFAFEQLIDIAGIDYASYGQDEWDTDAVTTSGFSRGVEHPAIKTGLSSRFAVNYQLLSYCHNERLSLKVFLHNKWPEVESVTAIWPAANWFEREAFDLFGIIFKNHPDLRRILTDYGFIGYPLRKDFPLIGEVEVRYDESAKRVVYEPVEITPRTLVPRVIRRDSRYLEG